MAALLFLFLGGRHCQDGGALGRMDSRYLNAFGPIVPKVLVQQELGTDGSGCCGVQHLNVILIVPLQLHDWPSLPSNQFLQYKYIEKDFS